MPYLFSPYQFIDLSHMISEPSFFLNYGALVLLVSKTPLSWHSSKEQYFQSLLLFPVLWPHPFLVLACRELNQNNPRKMINFLSDQFPHRVAEQLHKHQKGEALRDDSE